jgi:hypothetical protein
MSWRIGTILAANPHSTHKLPAVGVASGGFSGLDDDPMKGRAVLIVGAVRLSLGAAKPLRRRRVSLAAERAE